MKWKKLLTLLTWVILLLSVAFADWIVTGTGFNDGSFNKTSFNDTALNTSAVSLISNDTEQELSILDGFFNTEGLIGYWKLNNNTIDSSTNNFTGVSSNVNLSLGIEGKLNGAGDFRVGFINIINITDFNNSLFETTEFTWSFWVNFTKLTANDAFLSKWKHTINSTFFFQIDSAAGDGSLFIAGFTTSGGGERANVVDGVFEAGVWRHYVIVYNGSKTTNADKLKMYKDGVDINITTYTGTIPTTLLVSNADMLIGTEATLNRPMSGKLDEISMWTRAWNINEVQNYYFRTQGIFFGTQNGIANATYIISNTTISGDTIDNVTWSSTIASRTNLSMVYEIDSNGTIFNCGYTSPCTVNDTAQNITLTWSFTSNGTFTSELHNFTVSTTTAGGDSTNPIVTLESPIDNYNETASSSINFLCFASDDINLDNVTLYLNNTLNETIAGVNATNHSFTKTFGNGDYNWTCGACDNSSNCINATETRVFSVNITTDSNITNVNLISNTCTTSNLFFLNGTFDCIGETNCTGNWYLNTTATQCTLNNGGGGSYTIENGTSYSDAYAEYSCTTSTDYIFNLSVSNNGDAIEWVNTTVTCSTGGGGLSAEESSWLQALYNSLMRDSFGYNEITNWGYDET